MPVRDREILILRVLALAGAETEWAVHVELFAHEAGLTSAELAALATGEDLLPPRERRLTALAEALHHGGQIDDGSANCSPTGASAVSSNCRSSAVNTRRSRC